MSNLLTAISFLGVLPFLFIFWKRLKEDYSSVQIFTSGFYIIFSIIFFVLISLLALPNLIHASPVFSPTGLWFWGGVLGFAVGLGFSIWKLKLKFFESFESAAIGLLIWLAIVFFLDSVGNSSLVSLISLGVIIALIALFFFVDGRYKKFTWYRSGKIGFSGLATLGIFFLIRTGVALFFPFVLSFVGRVDALISGVVSFILFLLLYNLAEL